MTTPETPADLEDETNPYGYPKDAKGNLVPACLWITHWNEPRARDGVYTSGVERDPWEADYTAPITTYASNTPYVPADLLEDARADVRRLTTALAEAEALEVQHGEVIKRLTAERDAALAGAVTVKPLEWEDCTFCGQAAATAETEFGAVMIVAYSGRGGQWTYMDPTGEDNDSNWLTKEEAQADAQADYEARIRAALIPVPDTLRQVREALILELLQKHKAEMRSRGRNPSDYMSKWQQAADTIALLAKE